MNAPNHTSDTPADAPAGDAARVVLSVRGASKIYRMGEVDVPALRDATIDIRAGEFLVIVGPSGSGKSTLLNLIGGMDRPTSGSVMFGDRDLARLSDRQLTLYRRREVGFIFQFYNLIPTLTALENVQVTTAISARPMDAREALQLVGLADRADHFPSQLSGGQQQRVAIARAFAGNPSLLLCDEPTGALDSETSAQTLGLLWDLCRRLNRTVILITHEEPITRMADRIAAIHDGRIVSVETNANPVPASELGL